jgi:hypothetical protein
LQNYPHKYVIIMLIFLLLLMLSSLGLKSASDDPEGLAVPELLKKNFVTECNAQWERGMKHREMQLKRSPRSWFRNLSLVNNGKIA